MTAELKETLRPWQPFIVWAAVMLVMGALLAFRQWETGRAVVDLKKADVDFKTELMPMEKRRAVFVPREEFAYDVNNLRGEMVHLREELDQLESRIARLEHP